MNQQLNFCRWFGVLVLFSALTGCATTFGGFNRVVTRVAVKTTPPNLPYTFLKYELATAYLSNSNKQLTVIDTAGMQRLVDQSLMGLKSDSTVLNYGAGRHIIVVFCPTSAYFEMVTLHADIVNSVSVPCQ